MYYEYKDKDGDYIQIKEGEDDRASVLINTTHVGAYVPRFEAQAIASAVAGEPVILIKESELPEVEKVNTITVEVGGGFLFDLSRDAADLRAYAYASLAAARYLESEQAKNKAKDEELDELANELRQVWLVNDESPSSMWRDVARKAKELLTAPTDVPSVGFGGQSSIGTPSD